MARLRGINPADTTVPVIGWPPMVADPGTSGNPSSDPTPIAPVRRHIFQGRDKSGDAVVSRAYGLVFRICASAFLGSLATTFTRGSTTSAMSYRMAVPSTD